MIHPFAKIKYINDQIGYGLFASQFIPKGTIVYVKDSLEIDISEKQFATYSKVMQEQIEKYSYREPNGNRIVSWDFAKYVNHCCNCNTISTGYGFEIAIRDIQAEEEITDEYGLFNISEPMELSCKTPGCRKRISANDVDFYYKEWDEKIKPALQLLDTVDQPLLPLISAKDLKDLQQYFINEKNYRSVKNLKYQSAPIRLRS